MLRSHLFTPISSTSNIRIQVVWTVQPELRHQLTIFLRLPPLVITLPLTALATFFKAALCSRSAIYREPIYEWRVTLPSSRARKHAIYLTSATSPRRNLACICQAYSPPPFEAQPMTFSTTPCVMFRDQRHFPLMSGLQRSGLVVEDGIVLYEACNSHAVLEAVVCG